MLPLLHRLFISVLFIQTLGENAPWLVAFTHFTELKESKGRGDKLTPPVLYPWQDSYYFSFYIGIVLMVGEIDTRHVVSVEVHKQQNCLV